MGPGRRLMNLYFDVFYNRVYDLTTAHVSPYHSLQDSCIRKLGFSDDDRILCVGVGTGNEIMRMLSKNRHMCIIGVDVSSTALRIAGHKAARRSENVELYRMDAQKLSFADRTFDKAICLHVMGFLANDIQATAEIMRVLKKGAHFVITYPAGNGLQKLGTEVGRSLKKKLISGKLRETIIELLAAAGAWIANVPISHWVKPKQGFYSRQQLETILASFELNCCDIEEDKIYEEFIVYGTKGD